MQCPMKLYTKPIAIACSEAPEGRVRWTMDLLTEAVNKQIGVSIGRTAIYKVLLRNNIKPWLKKNESVLR